MYNKFFRCVCEVRDTYSLVFMYGGCVAGLFYGTETEIETEIKTWTDREMIESSERRVTLIIPSVSFISDQNQESCDRRCPSTKQSHAEQRESFNNEANT